MINKTLGDGLRPRIVSIPEACRYIGLCRSLVYQLLHDGVLKGVKINKRRLVTIESLDALIDANQDN